MVSVCHCTDCQALTGSPFRVTAICTKAAIGQPIKNLHHEHVHTRKSLVTALLDGEPIDDVLARAIACVVTRPEHKLLKAGDGWDRYSGIKVIDRSTGKRLPAGGPQ